LLSVRQAAGNWGSPQTVSATPFNDGNPDTDGATVVYESDRPSATDQDIYFRPLFGGPEIQLELPGIQRNPSISAGVIAFETSTPPRGSDLYVYVISKGALLQVTNTPTVDKTLSDVSVLPSGEIRVVWAANDDVIAGDHNIYARTFPPQAVAVPAM